VHDPELIILDEPLTGLDPLQRRGLIELFRTLGEQGRCIVVSSHVLDEVARIGSNVLVIAQGRLAATGDFRAIRGLMDDRPRRIRVVCDQPARLAAALVGAEAAMGIRIDGNSVVVDTNDIDVFGRQIAPLAVSTGTRIREVRPLDDDLESVFRYLVERS
jgi:ABC-2 type transport system ATP-binding protein